MFPLYEKPDAVVVVVDILRATSSIITAFQNGVERLIPVRTIDEAKNYKDKGFLIAAERDGKVLDFADFGNSPDNFTPEKVKGHTIVYSTTNGTQAIQQAGHCAQVVIGGFLNISALEKHLINMDRDVIILCAAWKDRFSLEDSVFAGFLADRLLESGKFETICDSAKAARDLWIMARPDLLNYIDKVAQRTRLRELGLDNAIEYCHSIDITDVIPVLENGSLRKI
ncbi:MAG: 2-phosphosulfolactate phosphatase [Chlorobi bacterium]|nr:2-phosphosulfolactate phosphatase [Chlorobiota bacterium]